MLCVTEPSKSNLGDQDLFGLYGITHGGGRVLTLLAAQGASRLRLQVKYHEDDARLETASGLVRFVEREAGGLTRLVTANNVTIVAKPQWDVLKRQFGPAAYR